MSTLEKDPHAQRKLEVARLELAIVRRREQIARAEAELVVQNEKLADELADLRFQKLVLRFPYAPRQEKPPADKKPSRLSAALKKTLAVTTARPLSTDKLIDFRQVNNLIGSKCQSGHTARALAVRGQITAIRINERVIRYSQASVLAFIAGNQHTQSEGGEA